MGTRFTELSSLSSLSCFPILINFTLDLPDCGASHTDEFLSALPTVRYLKLRSDIPDLPSGKACTSLRRLCLSRSNLIGATHHLEVVSHFSAFQFLEISLTRISDLSPLRACKSLRELRICGDIVTGFDIGFVSVCSDLEVLITRGLVWDFSPLEACKSLRELRVANTNRIPTFTRASSLFPISRCSSLLDVYITQLEGYMDFERLKPALEANGCNIHLNGRWY